MSSNGSVLQNNASDFFSKVFRACEADMLCKEGCDKCCYTSFSIHQWEADLIIEWFSSLSSSDRLDLKQKWSLPLISGTDPSGSTRDACPFLIEKRCSIYPVRPIICRTQGLPLLIEGHVDSCPLNFTKGLPDKSLWLDLERLNTLSSLVASQHCQKADRVEMATLRNKLDRLIF